MIYAFVAAVVSAALLIYFIVRIVRDPGDAKYAVHIPRWLFFFGMAVYIAGAAVCVAMLAVGKLYAFRCRGDALPARPEGRGYVRGDIYLLDHVRQKEAL